MNKDWDELIKQLKDLYPHKSSGHSKYKDYSDILNQYDHIIKGLEDDIKEAEKEEPEEDEDFVKIKSAINTTNTKLKRINRLVTKIKNKIVKLGIKKGWWINDNYENVAARVAIENNELNVGVTIHKSKVKHFDSDIKKDDGSIYTDSELENLLLAALHKNIPELKTYSSHIQINFD